MISKKLTAVVLLLMTSHLTVIAADQEQKWQRGSVQDVSLQKDHPGVITTAKAFEELYKKWHPDAEVPKVDFEKNLVLLATTNGSSIGGKPELKKGDLVFVAFSTSDFGPGFRYLFVVFPKAGVKTVNGKEIK